MMTPDGYMKRFQLLSQDLVWSVLLILRLQRAAALQHNSALTTLNLETNDIGGQGAQHLAKAQELYAKA